METYDTNFAPAGNGSSQQSESNSDHSSSNPSPSGLKVKVVVVIVVVTALVSAGLTAMARPSATCEDDGSPPLTLSKCDDESVNNLVKQAQEDRASLKQTLAAMKLRAEDAEYTVAQVNSDAFRVKLNQSYNLYVNKKYGFVLRLPRAFQASSALCEIDQDGIHVIQSGPLPIAAVEDWTNHTVYLVPEYHYIAESTGGQTTCLQVKHDLPAIQSAEVFVDKQLPVIVGEGLTDEAALLNFTRQKMGPNCEIVVDKSGDVNHATAMNKVAVVGGGPDSGCFLNYDYHLHYLPSAGRAYLIKLGQNPSAEMKEMANSLAAF